MHFSMEHPTETSYFKSHQQLSTLLATHNIGVWLLPVRLHVVIMLIVTLCIEKKKEYLFMICLKEIIV